MGRPFLFFRNKYQPPKALGNSETAYDYTVETWVLTPSLCFLVMGLLCPTLQPDLENPGVQFDPTSEPPESAQRLVFIY